MKHEPETPEWKRFNEAMRTILSVSHEEFKKRDAQWRKDRAKRKKRAKVSASRVPVSV